jgi:hypothetical protein
MRMTRTLRVVTFQMAVGMGATLAAQVQTDVPPVVRGAKPVTIERLEVHGPALEGNAADRDVIVFLPPSYSQASPATPWEGTARPVSA